MIDFGTPNVFSVGTQGEVGDRLFLLHVSGSAGTLTVKVEKQQVAVLASYLARIVRELGRPGHLPEDLDFDTETEPEWSVGTIGVSFDPDAGHVVVVIEESVGEGPFGEGEIAVEFESGGSTLSETSDVIAEDFEGDDTAVGAQVSLTPEQAAAFAIRATSLVEAGRPACPLCGLPLDPSGHLCPRTNGHRPPTT